MRSAILVFQCLWGQDNSRISKHRHGASSTNEKKEGPGTPALCFEMMDFAWPSFIKGCKRFPPYALKCISYTGNRFCQCCVICFHRGPAKLSKSSFVRSPCVLLWAGPVTKSFQGVPTLLWRMAAARGMKATRALRQRRRHALIP